MASPARLLFAVMLVLAGCSAPRLEVARNALADGEYFKAQELLRKEYNRLDSRKNKVEKGQIALELGECLLNLGMYDKAATALRNAHRLGCNDPRLDRLLNFASAEGAQAGSFMNTRIHVEPAKFLNSRRSESSPAIASSNPDIIYFASTSEKSSGNSLSGITGMKNSDIFTVTKDARGQWSRPRPLEGPVNTHDDEGTPSLTADGRTLYFSRAVSTPGTGSTVAIFVSQRSEGVWSEPEQLAVTDSLPLVVGHPSVSPDGKWLYFSSDLPGGFGGLDIWRLNVSDPGHPVNLGPRINTPGNESFPYLRNDSTLYFSSDTHPGFGGTDLFKASLNHNGAVTDIRNLGQPLNSRFDDFGIIFTDGESGYFSTNRLQPDGHDNIWSFVLPDLNITVSGVVTDRDDDPVGGALLRIVGDDGSNQVTLSGPDGSYEFRINPSTRYVMKAGCEGFLNQKQEFTTDSIDEDASYISDFRLAAIGKPQVLENIFYDFDKATLRPESRTELEELVLLLREHPNVTISLQAHTDRKGSDEYNMDLSQRRADSVQTFLIEAGIDPLRISSIGFGKSQPKTVTKRINSLYPQFPAGTLLDETYISTLTTADQEIADQINRRTEFSITSTSFE